MDILVHFSIKDSSRPVSNLRLLCKVPSPVAGKSYRASDLSM
jgi:hypothetical protein